MNYLKPILILGFAVPLLVFGACLGVGWYGMSWVGEAYRVRAEAYAQLQSDKVEEERLRGEVLPHRGAIAYFDQVKTENFEEKLPTYVSELFDTEFDGVLIRNGLDFQGDDSVTVSLTGRYDAMQKFIARLGNRFLFLETETINLNAAEPDASIPSRHLTISYTAKNFTPEEVGVDEGLGLGLGAGGTGEVP